MSGKWWPETRNSISANSVLGIYAKRAGFACPRSWPPKHPAIINLATFIGQSRLYRGQSPPTHLSAQANVTSNGAVAKITSSCFSGVRESQRKYSRISNRRYDMERVSLSPPPLSLSLSLSLSTSSERSTSHKYSPPPPTCSGRNSR
jgi:hypothetical protein